MKEFKILRSASTDELAAEVAAFLNDGWELHGTIFNCTSHLIIFYQAVTKETSEPARCCTHASCNRAAYLGFQYCEEHGAF